MEVAIKRVESLDMHHRFSPHSGRPVRLSLGVEFDAPHADDRADPTLARMQ